MKKQYNYLDKYLYLQLNDQLIRYFDIKLWDQLFKQLRLDHELYWQLYRELRNQL